MKQLTKGLHHDTIIMTLSFSTKINGKPNYFVEKIWESFFSEHLGVTTAISNICNALRYKDQFGEYWDGYKEEHNPKLHTIREDKSNRWGAGCDIHMVINNRTKDRFQFAPVIKCKLVQTIVIKHNSGKPSVYVDGKDIYEWDCEIENGYPALKKLAINDGFDSVEDFFAYFNKDFTGKIIHWTDLKY